MKYDFFAGSYGGREDEGIAGFRLDTEAGTLTKLWGYRFAAKAKPNRWIFIS